MLHCKKRSQALAALSLCCSLLSLSSSKSHLATLSYRFIHPCPESSESSPVDVANVSVLSGAGAPPFSGSPRGWGPLFPLAAGSPGRLRPGDLIAPPRPSPASLLPIRSAAPEALATDYIPAYLSTFLQSGYNLNDPATILIVSR